MSDIEEPPQKISKVEELSMTGGNSMSSMEEGQEEGQEEWLSESNITDEDFNTTQESQPSQDTTQTEANTTANNSTHLYELHLTTDGEANLMINQTMSVEDEMEKIVNPADSQGDSEQVEKTDSVDNEKLLDDLSTFLIRKTDGKLMAKQPEETQTHKTDDDTGNDTDDLLSMLGEHEEKVKAKKYTKTEAQKEIKKATLAEPETTDDELDAINMTPLKVAKNAVIKKYTKKSTSNKHDADLSTDEGEIVSKMFSTKKTVQTKKMDAKTAQNTKSLLKSSQTFSKSLLSKNVKDGTDSPITSTPMRTYSKKSYQKLPHSATRTQDRQKHASTEREDYLDEDEDDHFDIQENYGFKRKESNSQPLMRPEVMDEEMPSDVDSEAMSEGSYYDELPSSDSDGVEEWFALDIRAERAGEYVPLLGHKAYEMLTEEKRRVEKKLQNLKKNLEVLNSASKRNMDEIEKTRRTIVELDGLLVQS